MTEPAAIQVVRRTTILLAILVVRRKIHLSRANGQVEFRTLYIYIYLQRGEHVTRQIRRNKHILSYNIQRARSMAHSTTSKTDQQLWNILDRPGNPCYTRHVGLFTRKCYTFKLCMCVWSTHYSIKTGAVTNQREKLCIICRRRHIAAACGPYYR